MHKLKVWISAARLRTLPLSISGIIVGTALAQMQGVFNASIFVIAVLTTVCFQVTSNFANDYGDGVKGTDNEDRIGPKRALQSGLLTKSELKNGIVVSIICCILLVVSLVWLAFGKENIGYVIFFLTLGLVCVWAAIKYTVGQSAYGYKGLGDVFVFIFFGPVAVLGSLFLYTQSITTMAVFPAIAIGLLSTGVLNLNNLRDCESDKKARKNTLVVKLGFSNGKKYHYALLIISFLCMLAFFIFNYKEMLSSIYLLAYTPIFIHLTTVKKNNSPVLLDPELKKLALSTFLLAILFYISFNNFL